jgi:hypothetical protein
MWGISEYKITKQWPSVDLAYQQNEGQLKEFAASQIKTLSSAEQLSIEAAAKMAASSSTTTTTTTNTNSFLPSSDGVSDFIIKFYENLFREVMQFLQPALVQGHLDDLIGQRMFIEFILFMSCIFVGILFIVFIFSLIFVFNKDRIINLFKNKFIIWFLKYEAFLSKITLFIIPIFIFMGLFSIGNGLYWLLTHPIPYESLGVDLHQFVSSTPYGYIAEKENMSIIHSKLTKLTEGQDKLIDKLDTLIEKEISAPDSSLLEIGHKLDKSDEFCNKVKKILDNGPENFYLVFYPKVYKASVKCFEAQQEVAKFVDKLIESLNNKFVPDFNYLYDYLNSLNLLELSALFHLIVLSLICLISINIISAVLGNEIINFFKLEKKFPKLSSFLKIRLKFQKYYLILNFSLLFIICIVTIILDIFVLI